MSSRESISSRLELVIAEYLHACEDGDSPDRDALLSQNPELADELRDFFRHRDRMEALIDPFRSAATRVLNIRCPHCRGSVQMPNENQLSCISCPSCGSDFSLADPNSTAPPGFEHIGQFSLVECVGIGEFGTVWKAKDQALERTVAIKLPRRQHMEAADIELFLRDARVAAQLTHPHIVSVHEVGKHDNAIYIVSDFVQGATLSEWIKTRALSFVDLAKLCEIIARAIHYAHEQGVVHRDLKPGNVMMDLAGDPHIVDFGLAKREVGELTITLQGQILGTPAYMSPEQASGDGHNAQRGADIYSLGGILFELLTGELPFRGSRPAMLRQIIEARPPSPRDFNHRIPRDLETICLKCLEKEPQARYATAESLADDLRRFAERKPVAARPIPNVVHALRWCRRNPSVAGLSLAVALLLVSVAAVSTLGYRAVNENANTIEQNLYSSEMIRASSAAIAEEGLAEVRRLVNKWLPQRGHVDRRGWEWHYLNSLLHQDLSTLSHRIGHIEVDFSDDGQYLASACGDGTVRVWTNSGEVLHEWDAHADSERHQHHVPRVVWSPETDHLASFAGDAVLQIWDITNGNNRTHFLHDGPVVDASWIDSKRIVSVCAKLDDDDEPEYLVRTKWCLDSSTPHHVPVERRQFALRGAKKFCWKADGTQVATAPYIGPVSVFNPENSVELWKFGTEQYAPQVMAWNETGSLFACSDGHGRSVDVVDTKTARVLHNVPSSGSAGHLDWHPNGTTLAFADGNREIQIRDIADRLADGEEQYPGQTLRGHAARVTSICVHPDGKLIATGAVDGEIKIWRVKPQPDFYSGSALLSWHPEDDRYATRRGPNEILIRNRADESEDIIGLGELVDEIMDLEWSPDGTRLAVIGYNNAVVLVDVASKDAVQLFRTNLIRRGFRFPKLLSWHPDGNQLAVAEDELTIRIHDIAADKTIRLLQSNCKKLVCLQWSPDGNALAAGGEDCVLRIWDVSAGKVSSQFGGPELNEYIVAAEWSPDGARIVCASSNAGVLIWEPGQTGHDWMRLVGSTSYVHSVSWSSDGSRIASTEDSGAIRIWNPITGDQTLTLQHSASFVPDIGWSSKGRVLAAVSLTPNGIRIWNSKASGRQETIW